MKKCYHCGDKFTTIGMWKAHLVEAHGVGPRGHKRKPTSGIPNIVHYGARMRKKLGLEYDPAGHLRSTNS